MEANSIILRHLTRRDMEELRIASEEVYQGELATWSQRRVETLLSTFPEGQICICVDGVVVGCAFS